MIDKIHEKIVFRTIIEVLGKPQEHVEATMKDYVDKLKADKHYKILKEEFAEIKKQEKEELWATFTELEIEIKDVGKLLNFCFDYMPSMLEVIEPAQLTLSDGDISMFLNDLQAKLHGIDMVAKQVKAESDIVQKNMGHLLKNYITVLLSKEGRTSEELAHLTGVEKSTLEDFLDHLIDKEVVNLQKGVYSLKKELPKN
ncbi:hypothetical protein HYU21_01675 [Candidatus Woesearchaeota archaeon]|nr:hypothetical protein [Candidatus Woesearchaeota archaeon]